MYFSRGLFVYFSPHVHVYIRAYDPRTNTRAIPNNTKHMHDLDQKQQM
jgi:hypothetical protein